MPEPALHFQLDEYYLDLQKKGQDMEILNEADTQRNPFPGLRPFRTAEAHLFFGREGQAEELIHRLMQTHFLGVLGNSGSGKSSLVRAGLIPALHAGKRQQRVADWKIAICRPGNSPVGNLATALAGANLNTASADALLPEVQRLLPILQGSSFGLLEAEENTGDHAKTLLIVDQFEELFRPPTWPCCRRACSIFPTKASSGTGRACATGPPKKPITPASTSVSSRLAPKTTKTKPGLDRGRPAPAPRRVAHQKPAQSLLGRPLPLRPARTGARLGI